MKVKIADKKQKVEIENGDMYALDQTLAYVILPALKAFKIVANCIPNSVSSDLGMSRIKNKIKYTVKAEKKAWKEWHARLDAMIWSFNEIIEDKDLPGTEQERLDYYDQVQKGLDYFAKHYQDLWV